MSNDFYLTVRVFHTEIPLLVNIDKSTGRAYNIESTFDDGKAIYDGMKAFYYKFRRIDQQGKTREHDSRICSSSVFSNGEAEFRIEFADVYLSLKDICYACAYIANKRDSKVINFNDKEVIAYAIANL